MDESAVAESVESQAGTAVSTETQAETSVPAQETYVNSDGTFKEGWHNQFVPEEYRKNTAWLGIKSVEDATKQIVHLQTKLTSQGKGVFPITDKSTPEAVKEFRSAMGIPETSAGYKLNIPAEVQQFYPEPEIMQAVNPKLHALNLTPQQYAGVMSVYAEQTKISTEELEKNPLPLYESLQEKVSPVLAKKAEAELRTKWGDAYDARLNLANRAIEENVTSPEDKQEILTMIGNNPKVADFLATVYHKHFTESSGVDTSLGTGSTGQNLDQRIDSLRKDPNFLDGRTNPSAHKKVIEEINSLTNQKYPNNINV